MAQIVSLFNNIVSDEQKTNELDKFFLFSMAEKVFAVPVSEIAEVADYSSIIDIPQKTEIISGVVNVRSNIIPILNVRKRLFLLPDYFIGEKTKIIYFKTNRSYFIGMVIDDIDYRLIEGTILPNASANKTFCDLDFRPTTMEEKEKNRRFQIFSIEEYIKSSEFEDIRKVLESF